MPSPKNTALAIAGIFHSCLVVEQRIQFSSVDEQTSCFRSPVKGK
jgi:hypothetical protein